MALETIIKTESETKPVLVDIPVQVEKPHVTVTVETKQNIFQRFPRTWLIGAVAGVILVIIIFVLSGSLSTKPDLEIGSAQNTSKTLITPTPLAPVAATLSGSLAKSPYINPVDGYQITPPEGWVIDESKKTGASVIFLSPIPKTIGDKGFATAISVEVSRTEGVVLADQVVEIKKGLLNAFPDLDFEDDIQIYLQSRPFYLIGGTYDLDNVKLRKRTLITIYNNKGYAISASGPVVSWPDYEAVISNSLFSFKLL